MKAIIATYKREYFTEPIVFLVAKKLSEGNFDS